MLAFEVLEDRRVPSITTFWAGLSGPVEGVTTTAPSVATFAESDPGAAAGDFSATIDWGDGTRSAGVVSGGMSNLVNAFTVVANHAYAEEGMYVGAVSVSGDGDAATTTLTAFVWDAPLAGGGGDFTATEGVATGTRTLATFTDANPGDHTADFTATVYWGDDTPGEGAAVHYDSASQVYTISGGHTYAEAGSYPIFVAAEDDGDTALSIDAVATVVDAPLPARPGTTATATEGAAGSVVVATFTDANAGADASDFSATVDWGDGTTGDGTVTCGGGTYTVTATPPLSLDEGTYAVAASITDQDGAAVQAGGTLVVADATLSGAGVAVAATEGTATGPVTVAIFTDADPYDPDASYAATIDWGDGRGPAAGAVAGSDGAYSVTGAHTYAEEGTYTVTVTVQEGTAPPLTLTTAATVADAPITDLAGDGLPAEETEGVALGALTGMATFTDPAGAEAAGDYSAAIDWGDGSDAAGMVVDAGGGTFRVDAPDHTYAEEGTYTVSIAVGHDGLAALDAPDQTIVIADAPLTDVAAGPLPARGIEGVAVGPVPGVATFTDPAGAEAAGDYTATIDWGDGSTDDGALVALDGGTFRVDAPAHVYGEEGVYTIAVSIAHDDLAPVDVAAQKIIVKDAPLTDLAGGGLPATATENAALGVTSGIATFTDPGGSEDPADYTAIIDWGDGTIDAGTVVDTGGGSFRVDAPDHAYAEEGTYTVGVAIAHDGLDLVDVPDQTIVVADAQLTGLSIGGLPAGATEGASTGAVTGIASFTDPGGAEAAGDYAAAIDWGDGTAAAGRVVSLGGGAFRVDAPGHVYAEEGTYTVSVCAAHDGLPAVAAAPQTIVVADAPLAGLAVSGLPSGGTEGVALGALSGIATFSDPAGAEPIGDYSATIDWGDGTTDAGGVVPLGGGAFRVDAPGHTYGEDGRFYVAVSVTHDALPPVTAGGQAIVIADQPIMAPAGANLPARGTEGVAVGAVAGIATFTDPAGGEAAGDYTATIAWGDGSTDRGAVVSAGGGSFRVDAPDHTYAEEGTYSVRVTVTHDRLSPVTGGSQTIVIADQPLTGLAGANLPAAGTEGAAVGPVTGIASFADPAGAEATGDYTATIDWGDGSTDGGAVVALGGGAYRVDAPGHIYAEEGTYTVGVTVCHDDLDPVEAPAQTVTIADQALAGLADANLPPSGQEGVALGAVGGIATFTDPAGAEPVGDYTATIDWGDGTSAIGTVVHTGSDAFRVDGPGHTYGEEGTYTVTVAVAHDALPTARSGGQVIVIADQQVSTPAITAPTGVLEGAASPNGFALATFTDPAGPEPAGDYVATVSWGDGTPAGNGTVVSTGAGHYRVDAPAHAYAEEGAYTITVRVRHDLLAAVSVTASVSVADQQVTGVASANLPAGGTEGSGVGPIAGIATFTDPAGNGAETASDYLATVAWGDGATDAGAVVPLGGGAYRVDAPEHTYDKEGTYAVAVTLRHDALPAVTAPAQTIVIADAALADVIGPALPAGLTEGASSDTIAGIVTFTDPGGAEDVGDYAATIAWGDGSSSAGTVVATGGDAFRVDAPAHSYTEEGSHTVAVVLHHDSVADVTVTATATVADAPVIVHAAALSAAEGATVTGALLATFTDPGSAVLTAGQPTPGEYSASIAWGDGTADAGTIGYAGGSFQVTGNHTYAEEGACTATVMIAHGTTATATATAAVTVSDPAEQAATPAAAFVVHNTGLADAGQADPYWTVDGAPAVVVSDPQSLGWQGNPTSSAWISLDASGAPGITGSFDYATTFDLTGFDPATARLNLGVSADDAVTQILLNGADTGIVLPPAGGASWAAFAGATITAGFRAGVNTLAVLVANAAGPTGVQVLLSGTAVPVFAATEGNPSAVQTLATFTDAGGAEAVGDYTATVDWGDGVTTAGAISYDSQSHAFTIAGGHTYGEEGTDDIAVVIHHDAAPDVIVSGLALVSDPSVVATVPVVAIPLFGTGLDDTATPLAAGDTDPHWNVIDSPQGASSAIVVAAPAAPGWQGNIRSSQWISADDAGAANNPGIFTYETTLDLTGLDPATARVHLNVAAADDVQAIYLNGVDTRIILPPASANPWTAFTSATIGDGFQAGLNTLDIVVETAGGPTGLQVQLSGTAVPVFAATAGIPAAVQTIAAFSDPAGAEALSNYRATIDWADGTPASSGTIDYDSNRHVFLVSAGHTYAAPGDYTAVVTVNHDTAPRTLIPVALHVAPYQPPEATDSDATVHANSATSNETLSGDLTSTAFAPSGRPLAWTLTQDAQDGLMQWNGDGTYVYTPVPGFVGDDAFRFTVSDGIQSSGEATVTIHVADDKPEAIDQTYTLHAGQDLVTDAPGLLQDAAQGDLGTGALTAVAIHGAGLHPQHGTITVNPNGSFLYQPDPGFVGEDTFAFQVTDGILMSDVHVATIEVQNQAPVANPSNYIVTGQSLSGSSVLAEDSDPDGDALTAVLVSGPSYAADGSFQLHADGTFNYTLATSLPAQFDGRDAFVYRAFDGFEYSDPVTVTLTIADAPVGVPDLYVVPDSGPLTVDDAAGVLANDVTNNPNLALRAVLAQGTDPGVGDLTLQAGGGFTFDPGPNFTGTATFSYFPTTGQGPAPATPTDVTLVSQAELAADVQSIGLKETTFHSGVPQDIVVSPDPTTRAPNPAAYSGPQWLDLNRNGSAADAGDHQYPVVFVRSSVPTLDVKFGFNNADPAQRALWQRLTANRGVLVRATGPDGIHSASTAAQPLYLTLQGNDLLPTTGADWTPGQVRLVGLPDGTAYYADFALQWQFSIDGGRTWITPSQASTSYNEVYVTYGRPPQGMRIYHSLLYAAMQGAVGSTTAQALIDDVFSGFANRNMRRVDGTPLRYYGDWSTRVGNTLGLLLTGDGMCGAWNSFFLDVLRADGAPGLGAGLVIGPAPTIRQFLIRPTNPNEFFLVKNWAFPQAGNLPAAVRAGRPYPFYNVPANGDRLQPPMGTLILATSSAASRFVWGNVAAVQDRPGVPGQNSPNPISMFPEHVVLRVDTTVNGQPTTVLYDPSYGLVYKTATPSGVAGALRVFEQTALDGYVTEFRVNEIRDRIDINRDGRLGPEVIVFAFRRLDANNVGVTGFNV